MLFLALSHIFPELGERECQARSDPCSRSVRNRLYGDTMIMMCVYNNVEMNHGIKP